MDGFVKYSQEHNMFSIRPALNLRTKLGGS